MEPMNLGSAPSSPSTPGANPNFLPAFLMGEPSQPTSPNANISPGRMPLSNSRRPPGTSEARMFNHQVFQSDPSAQPKFTPHKPGPPSQGLFDTLEQNRKPSSPILHSTAVGFDSPAGFGRSISRLNNEDSFSCNRTFNESINMSQMSRVDRIDTHWVTVYGFPANALSIVLAQLSNCGVIVEKKVPPQGNWIHVKFSNLTDVPRALALNGRCINNCIMIGVNLYHNNENKENESTFTSPTRARSLRQSFVSPNASNSVLPPQNVPQKSTGIMSKAIEYVFGW